MQALFVVLPDRGPHSCGPRPTPAASLRALLAADGCLRDASSVRDHFQRRIMRNVPHLFVSCITRAEMDTTVALISTDMGRAGDRCVGLRTCWFDVPESE